MIRVNLSDLPPFKTITLAFQRRFCFVSFFPVVDFIAHMELNFLSKCKLNKSHVVEGNKLIVIGPMLYTKIFGQG